MVCSFNKCCRIRSKFNKYILHYYTKTIIFKGVYKYTKGISPYSYYYQKRALVNESWENLINQHNSFEKKIICKWKIQKVIRVF